MMSSGDFKSGDTADLLPHLRLPYVLGSVPEPVNFQTFGVDVQSDSIYWVKRGWSNIRESWLLAFGRESFAHRQSLDYERIGFLEANFGAIDCNYRTNEAFRVARDLGWLPLRGVGRNETKGKDLFAAGSFYLVDVNGMKDKLLLSQQHDLWHISMDTPDRYCRHLMSETRRGRVWDNTKRKANHWLDCEVYALTAALLVR